MAEFGIDEGFKAQQKMTTREWKEVSGADVLEHLVAAWSRTAKECGEVKHLGAVT